MAQTVLGQAPHGIHTHRAPGYDYRTPAYSPQPDFYGRAVQQQTFPGYAGQFGGNPSQPINGWAAPNGAPAYAPGAWSVPPAPRGLGRGGVAAIAGGGVLALMIFSGVVGAVTHHGKGHGPVPAVAAAPAPPTPAVIPAPVPPPPALIDDAEIPRVLPTEAHVTQVVGAASLAPIDKLNGPGMFDDFAQPAECVSVLMPSAKAAYAGSGVRATYVQALHDSDPNTLHVVYNGVSTFDSQAAANRFVASQESIWQGCQANSITLDPGKAKPTNWTVTNVAQRGDMLTARSSINNTRVRCQRALTTKLNVVVDVQVCAEDFSDGAATLASDTVSRVGQPT